MYFYSCEDFQVQRYRSTQQSLTQVLCVSYRILMWKTFSAHSKETSEVSPRSFGSVLLAKLQEPNPQASPWDPQLYPGPHPTWEGSLHEFPAGPVVWALLPLPRTRIQYLVRTKIPQAMQYSQKEKAGSLPCCLVTTCPLNTSGGTSGPRTEQPEFESQLCHSAALCVLGQVTSLLWVSVATFENRATEDTDFIEVLWTLGKVGHWGGKRTWH